MRSFSACLALSLLAGAIAQNAPNFNLQSYTVEGVILLPYAELKEPINAYFDLETNRSRVDYYGGLTQTLQLPNLDNSGANINLMWWVNPSGATERVCFRVNGTSDAPVTPTSVLPDLSGFKSAGADYCPDEFWPVDRSTANKSCELWLYSVANENKLNSYKFWLTRDSAGNAVPVEYRFVGADTLLGSHYDEYVVVYRNFVQPATIDDSVFEIASGLTCRDYPGPGLKQNVAIHDPIREFVHGVSNHIDSEFDSFKKKHGKVYAHKHEHDTKKDIFRHNYRMIQTLNRKNHHYKTAVNHLADWSLQQIGGLRGRIPTKGYNGGKAFVKPVRDDLPDQLDWRLFGAVNPIKDQAICGSCWSFGTTGTIEGTYFVKTGKLLRLSEQQMIDCSWQQGDNGCSGGEDWRAYAYLLAAGGQSLDEDYGGYLGQEGKCHDKDVDFAVSITGFVNVTVNDVGALEVALFENGPVTIAIDASRPGFSFYANGVYYDESCGNLPENLDHQVLAVGYGTLYGQKYWLVRNSWSTYWGNDGYILMAQKDNNCGVMTEPSYPLFD